MLQIVGGAADQLGFGVRLRRPHGLAVGAQQLLGSGDVAHLDGGDAARLRQQVGLDQGLGRDQVGHLAPGGVLADQRDEAAARLEGGQVAHHVAGAAQHRRLADDGQDRDRCLRRDALDRAVDITVEHHVADAEDPSPGKVLDPLGEVGTLGHTKARK